MVNKYYDHEIIRESSIEYYKKYDWIGSCDTYNTNDKSLDVSKKKELLDSF